MHHAHVCAGAHDTMIMDMDAAAGFGTGEGAPADAVMSVASHGSGLGDGRHSG